MKNREKPGSAKNSQYWVRKIPLFLVKKRQKLTTFRLLFAPKTGKNDHFWGPDFGHSHKTPRLRFWDPLEFPKTRKSMKIDLIAIPPDKKPDFWGEDAALRGTRQKNGDKWSSAKNRKIDENREKSTKFHPKTT